MKEKEANLLGWAEPNISWKRITHARAEYFGQEHHNNFKRVSASSDDPAKCNQQGGVCMGMVDKVLGRHIKSGSDDKGLGRWCYICLSGQYQQKIYIVTAYRPCIQHDPGDATVTTQQKRLLIQQGVKEPKPRNQWDKDLAVIINQWQKEGVAVGLRVDANAALREKELAEFISTVEMYDLMGSKHGINTHPTHNKRSHAIDYMFVTKEFVQAISEIGMLPFNDSIPSDH
eukprot:7329005-Ditylum_brightwellii.AAC.1